MQKITPCLWFDNEAEVAAKFYTSIFPNSKLKHEEKYVTETPSNKPIGSTMTVAFSLDGHEFLGLNGGPYFKVNPSISFTVKCTKGGKWDIDSLFGKLSKGGRVMMALDKYPFSERYAWVQDRFGISWQLAVDYAVGITPSLMFTGKQFGNCERAMNFYTSVFKGSKVDFISKYEKGEHDKEGAVKYARFHLGKQKFTAMESSMNHGFGFNEGISLMIQCQSQEEMDYYYKKLSDVPEAEVCGWLKDKFGVSWQLVPKDFDKIMGGFDSKKKKRAMEALMEMKRIDLKKLMGA